MRRVMGRLPLVVWLVVVWVTLWEGVSAANVLGGIAVAVGLLVVFPFDPEPRRGTIRPFAALHYVVFFVWKLVVASAIVAWEVITPTNRIVEGIVAVPLHGVSDLVVTLVANSITLTPGTITIEVERDPTVLYIHVLHLRDIEAVRREVQHLERLAVRAFGGSDALAAIDTAVQRKEPHR